MPVAALFWLMIIAMPLKIEFRALHHVKEHRRGVGVTSFINWVAKPFSMASLEIMFIVVPVIVSQFSRSCPLISDGKHALVKVSMATHSVSLFALPATLVLLFGFQSEQILAQPLVVVLLAVLILIQVYFNSGLAHFLDHQSGVAHSAAVLSAPIGRANSLNSPWCRPSTCSASIPVRHWQRLSGSLSRCR